MGKSGDRIPCDCRSKSNRPNVVIEPSLRRPKDHQNDSNWEPQIHFKVDPEIYAWNMYGMCMEYVWNMYGIWMEFVWNMHGIC